MESSCCGFQFLFLYIFSAVLAFLDFTLIACERPFQRLRS